MARAAKKRRALGHKEEGHLLLRLLPLFEEGKPEKGRELAREKWEKILLS